MSDLEELARDIQEKWGGMPTYQITVAHQAALANGFTEGSPQYISHIRRDLLLGDQRIAGAPAAPRRDVVHVQMSPEQRKMAVELGVGERVYAEGLARLDQANREALAQAANPAKPQVGGGAVLPEPKLR